MNEELLFLLFRVWLQGAGIVFLWYAVLAIAIFIKGE